MNAQTKQHAYSRTKSLGSRALAILLAVSLSSAVLPPSAIASPDVPSIAQDVHFVDEFSSEEKGAGSSSASTDENTEDSSPPAIEEDIQQELLQQSAPQEMQAQALLTSGTMTKTTDKTSASIGAPINYTTVTTAPKPANVLNNYLTYILVDVFPLGLKTPQTSQVTLKGSSLNLIKGTDYSVTSLIDTLTVTFLPAGIIKLNGLKADETLTLTYQTSLDQTAIIGGLGNSNTTTLTYTRGLLPDTIQTATTTVYSYGFTFSDKSSKDLSLLSGSKFNLYANYNDAVTSTNALSFYGGLSGTSLIGSALNQITTSLGVASCFGLGEGTYYLVEVQAPSGYTLLSQPVAVQVGASTTSLTASITIKNDPLAGLPGGMSLPATGGEGVLLMILGGTLLASVSLVGYIASRRLCKKKC